MDVQARTPADGQLSLAAAARDAPHTLALITDDVMLTFADLHSLVAPRVEVLSAARHDGGPLALTGERDLDSLLWLYAALETAHPVVLLHPRWTDTECSQACTRAGARWSPLGDRLQRLPLSGSAAATVLGDSTQLVDAACVVFTSGTSGRPKGAVLSRAALLAAARASERRLGWKDGDRWLLNLPVAHVGGLSVITRTLIARKTAVLDSQQGFDPQRFVDALRRHRVTLGSIVPTMLNRLVERQVEGPSGLRLVLLGGARADPRRVAEGRRLGWPLLRTYGMTEHCSQIATESPDLALQTEGAGAIVGAPLHGCQVRLAAVHGDGPLPAGPQAQEVGLLEIRGPALFSGYLGEAPEVTFRDGWFKTGDTARLHPDGGIEILDRRSDLIVTGGENVYPSEVERHLLRFEGVEEACVFGVPDDEWGQRVAAAVVLQAGVSAGQLRDALMEDLARFKVPRLWLELDSLPRAGLSKIDRVELRRLAASAAELS